MSRVYSLSVAFGLYHGLVFLPVLLTLAGGSGSGGDGNEEETVKCYFLPLSLFIVRYSRNINHNKRNWVFDFILTELMYVVKTGRRQRQSSHLHVLLFQKS